MFWLASLGLLLLHWRGALAEDAFSPPETGGWTLQQTLCHEDAFELVYGRSEQQSSLMLRPPNLPGFGHTPSFSVAYVKPDHITAAQEKALQNLASGVLVWLKQRDKGQWKNRLPCVPDKNLLAQWQSLVGAGVALSPRHRQPVSPWVKMADLVAIVGVAALGWLLLFYAPAVWRWWRVQPTTERRIFVVLLLLSVLLRLGPGVVADELFHGPWRVEDARSLPLVWGYYPPGVKAPLWWLMQVLPPSMDLFWNLNCVLGVLGALAMGLGVWRWTGPRAGCCALALMGLHPWAVFYAKADADTAAAMAGVGLFVLSLTLRAGFKSGPCEKWSTLDRLSRAWMPAPENRSFEKAQVFATPRGLCPRWRWVLKVYDGLLKQDPIGRWALVGLCAWWMAQQRPELMLLWPLLFLRRGRDTLWAFLLAAALHTPWLVAGFWHKAVNMAGDVNLSQQGWPVLREFLGLTLSGPPGAPAWPWLLWWGAALWFGAQAKKAAAWGALAGAFLLAVLLSSHGAGNALLGNLRYAMVFFPLLVMALAVGWPSGNKKALAGVVVLLAAAWLSWFQALSPNSDLQTRHWRWLRQTSPRLGPRCTVFLLAGLPGRGALHESTAYAARPLWPLSWPPQNCTLRVLTPGEEPRQGWLYLGPACYENQRGQDERCVRWRKRLGRGALRTTLPVHPRLWWQKGLWDERELETGFYPFSAPATEGR